MMIRSEAENSIQKRIARQTLLDDVVGHEIAGAMRQVVMMVGNMRSVVVEIPLDVSVERQESSSLCNLVPFEVMLVG